MSRNAAAGRFGVSIPSAVRWAKRIATILFSLVRCTPDIALLEIYQGDSVKAGVMPANAGIQGH